MTIEEKRADVLAHDKMADQSMYLEKEMQYIVAKIKDQDDDAKTIYLDQSVLKDGLENGLLPYLQKHKEILDKEIAAMKGEPDIDPLVGKYTHKGNVGVEVTPEINDCDEYKTLLNGECGCGFRWIHRKEIEANIADGTYKRTEPDVDPMINKRFRVGMGVQGIVVFKVESSFTMRDKPMSYRLVDTEDTLPPELLTKAELVDRVKNCGWVELLPDTDLSTDILPMPYEQPDENEPEGEWENHHEETITVERKADPSVLNVTWPNGSTDDFSIEGFRTCVFKHGLTKVSKK